MSRYSYMDNRDNTESFTQYPTPDSTQPLTNNSQSSQSNTTQIVDSFLSDIPHGAYLEYSMQDKSSTIPSESIDLAPHTPESLLCSPAIDERTDLNSRKQREQPSIPRRSQRIASSQTSELQSDSTQDSLNNRELMNKNPAAKALEVLNESTDFLITTSNMIHDNVHHSSQNQELDDEMGDIECVSGPHQVSHGNENEYPESVDLVLANEISDTLLRQSEHYNDMASKFSNLKFIKVQPESEEEIEQSTTSITPGIRRSTRKRTMANYSYPRYSYGGGRRSKTRKRNRSFRKRPLSITEDESGVDSEVVNIDNERSEGSDGPMYHNLSPVHSDEEQEANEDSHGIQADDNRNVDENIPDNELQSNLYLKHDLRSRQIMLELPEELAGSDVLELPEELAGSDVLELPEELAESKEIEKEPVAAYSTKKTTRSRQPVKKSILKTTFKRSAKTIPKRRTSRRSTSRKKNKDREWRPDEADSELDDDNEAVMTTPRGRRAIPKARLSSKVKKTAVGSTNVISEAINTKRLSSKKLTPKITKTPKTTRKGKKLVQSRVQGKGRGRITRARGSRSKNHDTEYIYSGEEETESEVETTEIADMVNDNSENQIVRGSSDAEMDEDDIEQNVAVVEELVSTPIRPKRTRKSTKSNALVNTHRSSRSTRSRRKDAIDDEATNDIHEPSDNETANVPEVQDDLIPATQPKKTTRSTKSKSRGGRTKERGDHVNGTEQPMVQVSSENQTTLTNAVRALTEKNFDIVHSPGGIASIEEVRSPVLVRSHSTPPPELQAIQARSLTSSSDWSNDHWNCLKEFYNETKSECLRSGKGREDVYKEVTKKFYEKFDINNETFEEKTLRNRIIAIEEADSEKSSEPSGGTQRRGSIESSSSKGSRSSVSRYNKAYSNLKRKRSESNATTNPEDKQEDVTEDKVSKRHRVEENIPSGSGTTSPSHDMNISQTFPNDSMFSRLFGGWFSGRSQSFNEETLANNIDENGSITRDELPIRSRSWWK